MSLRSTWPATGLCALMLLLTGLAGTSAQAEAACPWGPGAPAVSIEGNHVYVNDQAYRARGFGRNRLVRDMRACAVPVAGEDQLVRWQRNRRGAVVTGTVGAVFLWPLWVVTGVQIHGAVKNRRALETTLAGQTSPLLRESTRESGQRGTRRSRPTSGPRGTD